MSQVNSAREYNRDRLEAAMKHDGLDAVIASSPWNVSYLSGVSIDFSLLTFVVTTKDGKQGIVINEADAYFMKNDSNISDVLDYPYSDTSHEAANKSIDQLQKLVAEMGLADAKLGIESDFLPTRYGRQVAEVLPGAEIVDGSAALNEARIYKVPAEIDIMRHAAYFTDKAIRSGFTWARPGDTERDVANAMQSAVLRYGATTMSHTVCSAGVQSTVVHAHPLDKPIVAGDVLHVDFGGRFEGYQTDLARNAVVGEPSDRQREIYAHLYDIQMMLFETVKPGMIAKDIFSKAQQHFESVGLVYPWGTLGHSTGLLVHEGFEITRTSERVIESGMVLNLEPTHIEEGDARYHIEDTVLVTDDGVEHLSSFAPIDEMFVIY